MLSRRFEAFVDAHLAKIRKKLRTNTHPDAIGDLRLELETAFLLLRSDALHLTYEPEHRQHGRSTDFAVRYTTSVTFMTEVTRLRPQTTALRNERFTSMLHDKLGQLQPQHGNLILVGIETQQPTADELRNLALQAKQQIDRGDAEFVQRYGFTSRSALVKQYQRLSAVLIREIPLQAHEPVAIWVNPEAKYPLPAKVLTALASSHRL